MTQINALPCTQVGEDEVANEGIEEEDAEHDSEERDGADEGPDHSNGEILHDALYVHLEIWGYGAWGYGGIGIWRHGDMWEWVYGDMWVWVQARQVQNAYISVHTDTCILI